MMHRGQTRVLRLIVLCIMVIASSQLMEAQGTAGTSARYEPRYLIDVPTAGMIPHGTLALDMEVYRNGGLLTGVSLGAFDRLILGISYGGTNIIGNETPDWNTIPGFQIKFRLFDESVILPAIALGFDSQGKEVYDTTLSRYTIKSMGFYIVLSKNYELVGNLSFHGGVNYSLERADDDKDPNIFLGAEKSIGPILSVLGEYNLGWNDSNHRAFGKGRGYLNLSIRLSLGKGFSLGMNIKDILKNQRSASVGNRTLMLEYLNSL
jgi:hypothetical protein